MQRCSTGKLDYCFTSLHFSRSVHSGCGATTLRNDLPVQRRVCRQSRTLGGTSKISVLRFGVSTQPPPWEPHTSPWNATNRTHSSRDSLDHAETVHQDGFHDHVTTSLSDIENGFASASGLENEHAHEHADDSHGHGHHHEHSHGIHGHNHHHEHSHASHGHSHHHQHSHASHGHSHHHHHIDRCSQHNHNDHNKHNKLQRAFGALFRLTGFLQLSEWAEENVIAAALTAALFIIALGANMLAGNLAGYTQISAQWASQVSGLATICIYVLAGIPQLVSLCFSLSVGHVDTHVLMTLAVFGTLAIGGALEGALLLVLFQGSHMIEHKLTERAQGDLNSLFARMPEEVVLVDMDSDGLPKLAETRRVPVHDVPVGSLMLIRPGEQVGIDGEVIWGEALVSSEHITGEALPVRRRKGSLLPAGALDYDGVLIVRSTCLAVDSTPARIARLTSTAQANRPKLRRWIDVFGEGYSRLVIVMTVAALIILPLMGVPLIGQGGERGAVYRAMGLLTTASPCALVLVPLAYIAAIAAVSSRGILVKGAAVFDALASCTTIAFDKTGTLTTGVLSCTGVIPVPLPAGFNPKQRMSAADIESAADLRALSQAHALSMRATHPVSRAVTILGRSLGARLPPLDIQDFKMVAGAGVQGRVVDESRGSSSVRFGSVEFACEVLPPELAQATASAAESLSTGSVLSVLVEVPTPASGTHTPPSVRIFKFQDTLQVRSAAAVKSLQDGTWSSSRAHRRPFQVIMLTGDNEASAQRISRQLGILDVRAGLTPAEKVEAVNSLSSRNLQDGGVIMVGDGINDAPALAGADVGMAVASTPTDVAAAAADVILLTGDGVAAVPFMLRVAQRTQSIIRQNMVLALGSILALALPVLTGVIPLWLAVGLHEGSTVLVALNSLRLLHWRQQHQQAGVPIQPHEQPFLLEASEGSVKQQDVPSVSVAARAA
eukprot:jgi/Botrbrau1/3773/Bobra.0183s0008.1